MPPQAGPPEPPPVQSPASTIDTSASTVFISIVPTLVSSSNPNPTATAEHPSSSSSASASTSIAEPTSSSASTPTHFKSSRNVWIGAGIGGVTLLLVIAAVFLLRYLKNRPMKQQNIVVTPFLNGQTKTKRVTDDTESLLDFGANQAPDPSCYTSRTSNLPYERTGPKESLLTEKLRPREPEPFFCDFRLKNTGTFPSVAGQTPANKEKLQHPLPPPSSELNGGTHKRALSLSSMTSSFRSQRSLRRRVKCQFLHPLTADELCLGFNEKVSVLHTFVDGWCLIGKLDMSGNVAMGIVPEWCFSNSLPGLRPTRADSLQAVGWMRRYGILSSRDTEDTESVSAYSMLSDPNLSNNIVMF